LGFPESPFGKGGLKGIFKIPLGEGGNRGIEFKRWASPLVLLLKKRDYSNILLLIDSLWVVV